MHITFAPKGILQINDARITYKNFAGEGDVYNREGDRNFALIIDDQEIADALLAEGWNVKSKPPREEGELPFMYIPVKVKFNDWGPNCYLVTGNVQTKLDESTVHRLDKVRIASVDLDIRPYDWKRQEGTPYEKSGRTAYLTGIRVFQQEVDRFAADYGNETEPF
jgi:hypothetical protein